MKSIREYAFWSKPAMPLWQDPSPIREELFGVERLEQHAVSLAATHPVTTRPPSVTTLHARLDENALALSAAHRDSVMETENDRGVTPAAEWLRDNYHVVEEQIHEIRDDLPPRYYRDLPKLADGPFAGYPRVLSIAWAYVAHTDSCFDPETLRRFTRAYQQIQPLTIGELWAVAITLRIVLVENLRRMSDRITMGRLEQADADLLADRLLAEGGARSALERDIGTRSSDTLSPLFAARLAKRLRDQDPDTTPALGWLENRLIRQGSSIDEVVRLVHQEQGAANVTVHNIITSMRGISGADWADFVESVSLVDERMRAASAFGEMDFPSRNLYRNAIEQLARGSSATELDIADRVLAAAAAGEGRRADPGCHLIAEGRRDLERDIRFRAPPRLLIGRIGVRLGLGGYVGAILVVAVAMMVVALWASGVTGAVLIALAVLGFLPAMEVATALVNRGVTWSFGAMMLPGLDLTPGVPGNLRTVVAVPTLLSDEASLLEQIERLEVHYLSGTGGDISFALLADGLDAGQEVSDADAPLLGVAVEAIERLNRRHGPGPAGARFLFLHRRRVFNAGEGVWMGWERKRGKLHEFNRLLRGATDTTFIAVEGREPWVPADVRYVVTLDADTRLPRDAAHRLIGKMAHPLNRPVFDAAEQRVVAGHGILQPRVTPSLPIGREGSFLQRVFSGPGGMDPYAAAVSDVYQDLFGEGSFTGKGIYDVDAFEASLAGRVPENTLLSHDLFEGIFARAGLASDVEVIEEYPARRDVDIKRRHRWTRGDWQLLPWVFGRRAGGCPVPAIGRWKMIDNLARSLFAPFGLATLAVSWTAPAPAGAAGTAFVLLAMAIPAFLPPLFSLSPRPGGVSLRHHLRSLGADIKLAATWTALTLAFLPDLAWNMGDAIVRSMTRLYVSRRHLLEWTTAAGSARLPIPGFLRSYAGMAGGTALGLAACLGVIVAAPSAWPLALPFGLLWGVAPLIAVRGGRPPSAAGDTTLPAADERALRLIARRTWRYFETFVTPTDNMLPPDNFQEDPVPVVAHRTSPTNIGLYLLSVVAARDFGWAGTLETAERLEATFATLRRLSRYRGHFLNWYETRDLRALEPAYVSTVDSGNLAGHLIALAVACEEWADAPPSPRIRTGMADAAQLARSALGAPSALSDDERRLLVILEEVEARLADATDLDVLFPVLNRLAEKAAKTAAELFSVPPNGEVPEVVAWTRALRHAAVEHLRDHRLTADEKAERRRRLAALGTEARATALSMDFAFLLDPERKLFSIGRAVAADELDPSRYDLLASEARLASLFAIAKGDAPTKHWFRLGRNATPIGNGSALISWSGSMFEYLMPSLVMRAPDGGLLQRTNRLIVERQKAYGAASGVPWGISESAFNARDLSLTYQYSNFGVPGLGLKRGLSANLVVAPYATGLAVMVDPNGARRNYARLAALGALGRFGFYEAIDFTPSRVPEGVGGVVVRCHMAHHQGMTITAIANALDGGRLRDRFHREPMIKACELLMQERAPRDVFLMAPRVEETEAAAGEGVLAVPTMRHYTISGDTGRVTHLLSNGHYATVLTAGGGGYSRWRDIDVTRRREDSTRDDRGFFLFLRDTINGRTWSAGARPLPRDGATDKVVFGEDHAEFHGRDGGLKTVLEVIVTGDADGEVRRLSLTNGGRRVREIELTSYMELALASAAADAAHPAFSKMFVETEFLAEYGTLLATRRPRSGDEPPVWVAHFVVVEGEMIADPSHETDRARFIGRGRTIATAVAISGDRPLSNTVGTVLDPILSLRRHVRIPPGGVVRAAFWTMIAPSRAELLDIVDKHHDRAAFDRARTLAWTQAQVQLRHIDIDTREAADFQRLAAPILFADRRFRANPRVILRGIGSQPGLWRFGISGDLPIVCLRIDEVEDLSQVRQLLRAHEYWSMKRLDADLVIINDRVSSYIQELQGDIETAVRSSRSRPRIEGEAARGSVYALRADLIGDDGVALIEAVARVALTARRGSLGEQLALLPQEIAARPLAKRKPPSATSGTEPPQLEFFNGLGGFDKDGREYVVVLNGGDTTPAPWINVIANPGFGFQVSAEGSGQTWSENSRENRLTPWSNDPVSDPAGEALYVRDDVTGDVWCPTASPIRDGGTHIARHGWGYSRFEHRAHDIELDLTQFVPLADPVKISRLRLRNRSDHHRHLTVAAYAEWVLGVARDTAAPFVTTSIDPATGALFARNRWNTPFSERVAFSDLNGGHSGWTADRLEFLGRDGEPAEPAALFNGVPLSGAVGAGFDPCAALSRTIELDAGESIEVVWFLGQCASDEAAQTLILRLRATDPEAILAEVMDHWTSTLGTVRVRTPDRAMDVMLNGWLTYQSLACRVWARSAFYQASGAYGFRDQLQDGTALTLAAPQEVREHILRAAGRQFAEGDVQHWWLPHSGQGVRTRISDDPVWLAHAVATYVARTGDAAILDETTPFLSAVALPPDRPDDFSMPKVTDEMATLFEHCACGLDRCLALIGEHGMPLMGSGDWNDGMNRIGAEGRGESVWLGWFLIRTIAMFAPLARTRDPERLRQWQARADSVREAIEREAWDGAWYRRAIDDDGVWIGTAEAGECRIDSIVQSWAVLSGAAEPERASAAMASLDRLLIRRGDALAVLFAPPFDTTPHDPGYIKGYPPGLRENGGQYSHAAMWTVAAFAERGEGDKAVELFAMLNPINHARTRTEAERYKVEPYVVAADVYSVAPHVGRGGWTWYTGSAAWMWRAGVESILGIRRDGSHLIVAPNLPAAWPGFEAAVTIEGNRYAITVTALPPASAENASAVFDGQPVSLEAGAVRAPLGAGSHTLLVRWRG
jgi:cyclic beta-1,2-glucan synthetase